MIYVNVYGDLLDGGDFGPLPGGPTVDPGPGPTGVLPSSGNDSEPPKIVPEPRGGGGTGITDGFGGSGLGDFGFETMAFELTADAVLQDEKDDSKAKLKKPKYLYDGVLDGFEFQGFAMNSIGINHDVLWEALDDMQRQMKRA